MKDLKGKLVVITGGARGIGYAIAEKLSVEGSRIVIADINFDMAQDSANKIAEADVECYAYKLDVSSTKEIEAFFAQLKDRFGRIDVFVNNAGIQIRRPSLDFLVDDWDKLMDINLKASFFCNQQAGRNMKENGGGVIVNISSGTSTRTTPGRAPYVISKAGVNAMTAVLASEWAKYNIRVNAIAPGWIMTEMLKEGMKMGIVSDKQMMSAVPLKRYATTGEIADAVVYLASGNSSYITGQTLFVDGGWSSLGLPDMD